MVERRRLLSMLPALALAAGLGRATLAAAQSQSQVDLDLVLAVDCSGSVNAQRFELQRRGYAAAFRSPEVLRAIRSGPHQAIAVTLVQWTGQALQVIAVPWMSVRDERSARALADAIDAAPRGLFAGGTSISGAIDFSARLLAESPFQSTRRLIDVSGDGSNNNGRPAKHARDDAVRAGIGINGLPILTIEPDLDQYYAGNVIGGPNAFMIPIADYETFADAIRRKLILEIAGAGGLAVRSARSEAARGH